MSCPGCHAVGTSIVNGKIMCDYCGQEVVEIKPVVDTTPAADETASEPKTMKRSINK